MLGTKTWKDHLLSSGLPLEQSVVQVLKSLGVEDAREYKYEKPNEQGVPTTFSVDIHATLVKSVWLEFFIECKYRHDGTQWIFTPDEYSIGHDDSFFDSLVVLDELLDCHVDNFLVDRYSDEYVLCGKGVELLNNDANPKSIEQAIQQLRYALVEESADCLREQAEGLNALFVLVPIVVTTAELWRLRPNVTIERLRSASCLDEVADQYSILLARHNPDNQLIRHTRTKFDERLDASLQGKFKIDYGNFTQTYKGFLSRFSSRYPAFFYIVHYDRLNDVLRNLMLIFDTPDLVKKR